MFKNMNGKSNIRQRAISDYNFIRKTTPQVIVYLQEAKLLVNVSRIGNMYAYAKVKLGKLEFVSLSSEVGGQHPKWNQFFSFPFSYERLLSISVFDKSILFGETEIGRCLIDLSDVMQGRSSCWWKLLGVHSQVVGEVLLSFEFTKSTPRHTPTSSLDSNPQLLESPISAGRGHLKHQTLQSTRTPDLKITHCSTEPDEIYDLESLRDDMLRENDMICTQENNFRSIFEKLKLEKINLKQESAELNKMKEELQKKEEKLLKSKIDLKAERALVMEERESLRGMKEKMNLELEMIRLEQMRSRVWRICQGNRMKRVLKEQERIRMRMERRIDLEDIN